MINALNGMNKLAQRIANYDDCLCLLGLGSMSETFRMDEYSDMDFFLIVKNGSKSYFMNDLEWLAFDEIVFSFQNSNDGYKALFKDGNFAEFAIFTEDEILEATFTLGKVYYARPGFDLDKITPRKIRERKLNVEYNVCEALANIYIGLNRLKRGEIASATTFIQSYAFNLIIDLFSVVFTPTNQNTDYFVAERRIEERYKEHKNFISNMRKGYEFNKESAEIMLNFLIQYFEPNIYMVNKIKKLLQA